jgi:CO dehydrogenase/acetyl-CoA synthase beta subunit
MSLEEKARAIAKSQPEGPQFAIDRVQKMDGRKRKFTFEIERLIAELQ